MSGSYGRPCEMCCRPRPRPRRDGSGRMSFAEVDALFKAGQVPCVSFHYSKPPDALILSKVIPNPAAG